MTILNDREHPGTDHCRALFEAAGAQAGRRSAHWPGSHLKSVQDDKARHQAMVAAAGDFCRLIERIMASESRPGLADLSRVLSRLKSVMNRLSVPVLEPGGFALPDLDEKFDFFCRLKERLGRDDAYRMRDDAVDHTADMSGSLAGDLADIYFELKAGLCRLEAGRGSEAEVFTEWQRGYWLHWGQRLVDAHRHLSMLAAGPKRSGD